ncbi:MAG: alkaline phosphatase family protein [Candidatus Bathyarchaeota archaeon]|nr:alkaline phosphatase family protein [Candidatus Bathyarchaeota archaeon]
MLVQKLATPKNPDTNFIYPQYERACISNIPNTILSHFHIKNSAPNLLADCQGTVDAEKANKVVLLVVDGFGFDQFINHHKQNPFLKGLTEAGEVSPLTSVFPSQTTNALTTLNTGLTPQQHGMLEYFIYLKNIGLINALQFERIGGGNRKLIDEGFDPSLMFNGKSIHQTLSSWGVSSFAHMQAANSSNACSKLIFKGSTMVPSLKTSDTIVRLRKNLEETSGNAYFFVHLDTLDTISHQYGPQSIEYQAELATITYLLQRELVEKLDSSTAKETLLLLTADHGGIESNPNRTIYLNLQPKTMMNLQRGSNGKPIMPTGGPREIFLHIKEDKLQETKAWLMTQLGDRAEIVETAQAVEEGLFGVGAASQDFLDRAGNLLILPCGGETVWFEQFTTRITFMGQHGGLCEEEMLVPFAVSKLDELKK